MSHAEQHGVSKEKFDVLYKAYHDLTDPGAYSSISKLFNTVKHIQNITKTDVRNFLKNMLGYTRHGPIRRRFIRRPIICSLPGHILGADLADFSNLKKYNRGYRYILFLIDMFSRKLDVFPIKDKKNSTVANVNAFFFQNYKTQIFFLFWRSG